uniref:CSN8/PSMD8/EIF3K domain-containing protein n=1 Tax=Spongospora subterranea TaxID=70186 RepID=A0A0H5QLV6_9EUKA|eukprot:CRZ03140.1 hypothetical protein [Spongospora subterranea]
MKSIPCPRYRDCIHRSLRCVARLYSTSEQKREAFIVHALQFLIAYDILGFKLFWVRVPAEYRQEPALIQLHALAHSLHKRDFIQFQNVVRNTNWEESLVAHVESIVSSVTKVLVAQLSRSFTRLDVNYAAKQLGYDVDGVVKLFLGSTVEKLADGRQFLVPQRQDVAKAYDSMPVMFSDLRQHVNDLVCLEQFAGMSR